MSYVGGVPGTCLGFIYFAFFKSSQYVHMAIGLQSQRGLCSTHVEQDQHLVWVPHLTAQNVGSGLGDAGSQHLMSVSCYKSLIE